MGSEREHTEERRDDDLLATLSREVREPLAPLRVAVQLLRRRLAAAGLHDVTEVDVIERQIDHLTRLVDGLVAGRPGAPVAAAPDPLRILVVDDNEDAAELLAEFLAGHGHVTRVAYDGPSALTEAAAFAPDLILLDLGLPGLDGYEVARELHASSSPATLVALTGYGQDRDRKRVAEAGFAHHLVKPVDVDHLMGIVAAVRPRSVQ